METRQGQRFLDTKEGRDIWKQALQTKFGGSFSGGPAMAPGDLSRSLGEGLWATALISYAMEYGVIRRGRHGLKARYFLAVPEHPGRDN